jgi:hypothetical protein
MAYPQAIQFRRLFWFTGALFALFVAAAPAIAESNEEPDDCLGVGFDVQKPVVIAGIIAGAPKVFYVKSAWEAESCPSDSEACRRKAYLVPGDLVLSGKTHGPCTCIAYQSPRGKKQVWTSGWIPSVSLSVVAPSHPTRLSDWIGTWSHAGGEITIKPGENGKLSIQGLHVYRAALNVHTGTIEAEAQPAAGMLAFAGDGTTPFDDPEEDACRVRMQRLGAFLVVEDDGTCGGIMVTFTGFYQRRR